MSKQGKTNYKKKAWKMYQERGRTKTEFEEHWREKSKLARQIFAGRHIKYSHYVFENLTANTGNNPIDEFYASNLSAKEFRTKYFNARGQFAKDVVARFKNYLNYNAKKDDEVIIIREKKIGGEFTLDYDISKELYDKLIDIKNSPNELINYSVRDLFNDFIKGNISYKDLIDNIELIRTKNEEIAQRNYN